MALSDRQIERYSRQIIVPGIGGRGQERLLAATLAITGETADLDMPLAYLAGAGIGTILVETAGGISIDPRLIADLGDLNEDSRVAAMTAAPPMPIDCSIILIGSANALKTARGAIDRTAGRPVVLVRLDAPPRIASLAATPCPLCAGVDLLGPFGKRAEQADFIAMLATAEALRLLTSEERALTPRLFDFSGYQSQGVAIGRRAGTNRCQCESRPAAHG